VWAHTLAQGTGHVFGPKITDFRPRADGNTLAVCRGMTPTIDFSVIELLRGLALDGDPDPIVELRSLFIEDAARHIQALNTAVASGDERTAKRAAHSLKGMCGSIGAQNLYEMSSQFEVAPTIDPNSLRQLESEFVRVTQALQAA